jgi:hydroxyacylglutathione hydrolase
MNIKNIKVGSLQTNCYILEKDDECIVIDPGDEANKIINIIDKKVIGIIITHYHFDHVGALEDLKAKYKCPVYDYTNLKEGMNTISNFTFECIYTPGHKSDSISLLFDKALFCGDFIFKGSIGRTDVPTASMKDMQNSIKKMINKNPDIIIYPGHGESTSLKNELNNLKSYL